MVLDVFQNGITGMKYNKFCEQRPFMCGQVVCSHTRQKCTEPASSRWQNSGSLQYRPVAIVTEQNVKRWKSKSLKQNNNKLYGPCQILYTSNPLSFFKRLLINSPLWVKEKNQDAHLHDFFQISYFSKKTQGDSSHTYYPSPNPSTTQLKEFM